MVLFGQMTFSVNLSLYHYKVLCCTLGVGLILTGFITELNKRQEADNDNQFDRRKKDEHRNDEALLS